MAETGADRMAVAVVAALDGDRVLAEILRERWDRIDWPTVRPKVLQIRPNAAVALDAFPRGEIPGENGTTPRKLYTLVSDLEAEALPQPEWGIEGIYPNGGLVVLFGPRGTGKTFVALAWSFAHATGFSWLGRAARVGPVVYILSEGRGGLGIRVRAQKEHLGFQGEAGVYFITMAVPMLNDSEVDRLIRTIETLDPAPVAIIWDTLSRTFIGGDENSSKDMATYVAAVDRVKEAVGGTAIVQHHTGHGSSDRERGSSVLGGAADTIIALREKDGVLELACEKQKDAVEFAPIPLQLQKIEGAGSCVFVTPKRSFGVSGLILTPNELVALKSLQSSFLDDGAAATTWLKATALVDSSFYGVRTSLVRKGLVDQKGEGRGARYVLTDKGRTELLLQSSNVAPNSLQRPDASLHSNDGGLYG